MSQKYFKNSNLTLKKMLIGKELEIIIPSHFRYCFEVRPMAKLNEIKIDFAYSLIKFGFEED